MIDWNQSILCGHIHTDLVGWSPNHFVPCIPKDMFGFGPPPKVAKLDQNIKGIDTGEYTYFSQIYRKIPKSLIQVPLISWI